MKIAILTPCYSGDVNLHYSMSLVATMRAMQKTDVEYITNVGSSILHMARNILVAQAMARGADKLVFIDDDVSWTNNGFERLVLAPGRVVGGVYQKKPHNPHAAPVMAVSTLPEGMIPNQNGLVEVDAAATGFLRIDREVLEGMKPYCQKVEDDFLKPEEGKHLYEYFAFGKLIKDNKTYAHGEDYHFCHKAREAGFKTYIDPNIKLGHHLGQFKFDASLKTIDLL